MVRQIRIFIIPIILILSLSVYSQETTKTIRIGYFEGGAYFLHKTMLREVKSFLESMIDTNFEIIYEPYGYKSAEWERDKCRAMAHDLARMKDIDLVIAAGPWVVEDLLEAGFDRPIVGICQFDPEAAGLVDHAGKPIAPNLTVNYRPGRRTAHLKTIQELFPSREIGLLYFPSGNESGKLTDKVHKAAGEYGAVVFTADEYSNRGLYSFFKSFKQIRNKIDVLYVPPLWGMDLDQIRQLFIETQYARVPTFASDGFIMLEKGATASNSIHPHRLLAKFTAHKIWRVINGAGPSSLPTIFDEVQGLCLNLEAANRLGVSFSRNQIDNAKTILPLPGDTIPHYTFSQAHDQALRENAGLLLAGELYQMATVAAQKAYSAFFPHVNMNISAATTNNQADAVAYNQMLNREFSTDIIIDQKLFSFPAIKAIRIAKKNLAIEKASLHKAEMELKHTVTLIYLSILQAEDKLAAHKRMIDRLREYWEMAVINHRLGLADTLDIPLLEERLVSAKLRRYDAQSELKVARVVLNVLLNRPGDEYVILDREEFSPEKMAAMVRRLEEYTSDAGKQKKFEEYLIQFGIGRSIDMEIAALSIGIQKDLISRNKNRYFPELSLRAKYAYSSEFEPATSDRKDSWTFGGILNFPIFLGGERIYNRRFLNAKLDELLYKRDSLRFSKLQEIISKADRLTIRVATLPMRYFVKNLSSANLKAAYQKYDRGDLSVIDLIILERNASESEINLIEDRYQFFISYAELLNAIGTGYLIYDSDNEKEFFDNLKESMKN